jgi:hypothetical protein
MAGFGCCYWWFVFGALLGWLASWLLGRMFAKTEGTGITQLHRYYEPLRHPIAAGPSLTGVRLILPITRRGFPCCVRLPRFPCVHAVATTPARRLGSPLFYHPAVSTFPDRVVGSARASSFSRLPQRSLTLRPAHSRCHRMS